MAHLAQPQHDGFVQKLRIRQQDGTTTTTLIVVVPDATSTNAAGAQVTDAITTAPAFTTTTVAPTTSATLSRTNIKTVTTATSDLTTDIDLFGTSDALTSGRTAATRTLATTSDTAASDTSLTTPTSQAVASSSTSSKNHTAGIAAGVSIAAVLILFILGGWLYRKYRTRQENKKFTKGLKDEDFGNSASGPAGFAFGSNAEKFGGYGTLNDEVIGGAGAAGMGAGLMAAHKQEAYEPSFAEPLNHAYPPPPSPSMKSSPRSPFEDPAPQSNKSLSTYGNVMMKAPAPPTPTIVEPLNPFEDHVQADQGGIHPVVASFDPAQDDELNIVPGDHIQILATYDDGWALGINLSSGTPPQKGVFPFDCVGPALDSSKARGVPPQRPSRPPSSATPATSANFAYSPATAGGAPAIQISSEDDKKPRPMTLMVADDKVSKRTSSLASSRAASLLGALGDVLDEKKPEAGAGTGAGQAQ